LMTLPLGQIFTKTVELVGPVLLRELAKPRTRRFLEEKAGDVAIEIARRFQTKKSKKIIIRKGRQSFECRRVN